MNELLAGAMAAFVYLTQVSGVPGEVFEYNSLACTTSHRQGDDVLIGCGSLQVAAKLATSSPPSSPLAAFRKQYPEYNDMSDAALANAIYRKFYSDMPRERFDTKVGELSAAIGKPAKHDSLSTDDLVRFYRTQDPAVPVLPSARDVLLHSPDPVGGAADSILPSATLPPGFVLDPLPELLAGVMHFGRSIQELEPVTGNEEPWSVALRLLPGMSCSQWQGKYWKCHTGERPPPPPGFVPLGATQ